MRSDGRDRLNAIADLTQRFPVVSGNARERRRPSSRCCSTTRRTRWRSRATTLLPFRPSAREVNYLRLDNETDPTPLLNRYRNSVHYVDALIGRVLDAMEQQGLLENSVIVVTGDHGQEFNDSRRNYWGHGSNFTRYQTGVPLLLYSPTLPPGVHRHRTTHFDIVPTLMRDHLGCGEAFQDLQRRAIVVRSRRARRRRPERVHGLRHCSPPTGSPSYASRACKYSTRATPPCRTGTSSRSSLNRHWSRRTVSIDASD